MADLLAESIQAGFILRKHQPSNWSPTETRGTSIRASVIALSLQLELSVKQNAILNTIWNMGLHFNIMEKTCIPVNPHCCSLCGHTAATYRSAFSKINFADSSFLQDPTPLVSVWKSWKIVSLPLGSEGFLITDKIICFKIIPWNEFSYSPLRVALFQLMNNKLTHWRKQIILPEWTLAIQLPTLYTMLRVQVVIKIGNLDSNH